MEAWFSYHLNQAYLATVSSLKTFLVDVNLYELVDLIESLYLAVSANHTETSLLAWLNLIIKGWQLNKLFLIDLSEDSDGLRCYGREVPDFSFV